MKRIEVNVTIAFLWVGLMACGGAESGAAANAEPKSDATEPTNDKAAEPEPAADTATVMFPVGIACQDLAEGLPADLDAVRAKLVEAGAEPLKIENMPVCKACTTCPRAAYSVEVKAADEAKVTELVAPWNTMAAGTKDGVQ